MITVIVFVYSVVSPTAASDRELRLFHSAEYLDCLQRISQLDDDEKFADSLEEFGLGMQHSALQNGSTDVCSKVMHC